MFIIQFIIKIVFFIINNIFSLFGYDTIENEKKYRKYINYFLNVNGNTNINNTANVNNVNTTNNSNINNSNNIEINSDRNTN